MDTATKLFFFSSGGFGMLFLRDILTGQLWWAFVDGFIAFVLWSIGEHTCKE